MVFANPWMFYQEALPRFWFVSRVDSLLTIADRHWRTHLRLHGTGIYLFMWGAYFVWVLIIPILQYVNIYGTGDIYSLGDFYEGC